MEKEQVCKKILGLDLGSNSLGWAILEENAVGTKKLVDIGVRIFPKSVGDKTPIPKNVNRRDARLARRVLQRRARRKQKLVNFLVELNLLPSELLKATQPEILLNAMGDPYQLRAKALDEALPPHQLGRVFLHLVQRRGFLSNRKSVLGDMLNDPDVEELLEAEIGTVNDKQNKEETDFKQEILQLKHKITEEKCRTLGEYLAKLKKGKCKRNRKFINGQLRTDRSMYQAEIELIWQKQKQYHTSLSTDGFKKIKHIIFYQRPLKLKPDRVGGCSLEKDAKRSRMSKLEVQRFRYLQDINNLKYTDNDSFVEQFLNKGQRKTLQELLEKKSEVTYTKIKNILGLSRKARFNLESSKKKLKGNTTAYRIREVLPEWDDYLEERQLALVEDLITINKKSTLNTRLINHWKFSKSQALRLVMLEFENGHSNHSLKSIKKLLPYLTAGDIYSDARQKAGYTYEVEVIKSVAKLAAPPETSNPIVNRALHELKRVVNAIILEYGKPTAIRVEMARDLEMNTKRYKAAEKRREANEALNEEAEEKYQEIKRNNSNLLHSKYANRDDKIKYRLWRDQSRLCAYSGKTINLTTLFTAEIEIDHIIPFSLSLDDSYMNKVVCFANENRFKGQRTPKDAFSGDKEKWNQILQAFNCCKDVPDSKKSRFNMTVEDAQERDFAASQLNDTRYVSRLAIGYLKSLGDDVDVSVTKGQITAWLRHQWGLNRFLGGKQNFKERNDHRHHAIDAAVIAAVDRSLHTKMVSEAKILEQQHSQLTMRDIYFDMPYEQFDEDLERKLDETIIAWKPERKINGALHEDTGRGFIKLDGGMGVTRWLLSEYITKSSEIKKITNIIDKDIREIVCQHVENYKGNIKEAFTLENCPTHKDGITPIRRVRICSTRNTTDNKMMQSKFPIKDRNGRIFKYYDYGNTHHVEIIRHKNTGKVSGEFVTMLEAAQRIRGINGAKRPLVQTEQGHDYEFLLALHKDQLVQMLINGKCNFYRVVKLNKFTSNFSVRLHTLLDPKKIKDENDSNQKDKLISVSKILNYDLKLHPVNVLGKSTYAQANR